MPVIPEAQRYVNCLAELLGIVNTFPPPMNQLCSIRGYVKASEQTWEMLDHAWLQGRVSFFRMLEHLTASLKSCRKNDCYARAASAARWMDQRIRYQEQVEEKFISLYGMVPLSGDRPVFVDKLNTNDQETGVQLHPKFEVCKIYNQSSGKRESFANRDIYYGLNGQLNNVSYVAYDAHLIIHNAVIPYEYKKGNEDGTLRIAFCPMSDNTELLNIEPRIRICEGIEMNGVGIRSLNNEQQLLDRFREDLLLACREEADIIFFPEMLGMEALEQQNDEFNTTILDLELDVTAEAKKIGKDMKLPMLICLPTRWRDGVNSMTAAYRTGHILGVQKKYIPYVDATGHLVEALKEEVEKHILVIHVPGIHRIVTVICAEFQPMRDYMAKVLCGGLGASLILVPSYTKGEQDFLNSLPTLKDYGATVIWGNCCGAAKKPRVIGGCSIAGLDEIQRFGHHLNCGGSCQENRACLFLVTLPLKLSREKPHEPTWEDPIKHCILT